MSTIRSIGTFFELGLRTPNYVNGRTLHAEDLRADQTATLARLVGLGHAIGPGVVAGLDVRLTPASTNSLQVDPGSGINARGDVLQLSGSPVTLSLVIAPETASNLGSAGLFQPCATASPGETIVIDQGAYLLAIAPVSRLEGTTPVTGAAQRGNTVECAAKWQVDGLEFKAIRLTEFGADGVDDGTSAATRRNRLAHWCLGSRALAVFPFPDYDGAYSGIDRIAASILTPCDLPLAVFYWDDGGVAFVDGWAARRRLAGPFVAPAWGGFFGQKRVAEGEARLLQFQAELADLFSRPNANPQQVRAADHFPHLPPVGFLPTTTLPLQALAGACLRTFNIFFSGGRNPDSLSYSPLFVAPLIEPIAAEIEAASGAFVRLQRFWGELLPDEAQFINLEQADLLLERTRHQDAIDLVQAPAIAIYFIEEYLLLYLARLLLDGIDYVEGDQRFDILDVLAIISGLRNRNDNAAQLTPGEWFVRSLSVYLNMPLGRLEEALDRVAFPHAMFVKELVEPASIRFDVPDENEEPPVPDFDAIRPLPPRGTAPVRVNPAVATINTRLSRPNLDPATVLREARMNLRPTGPRPLRPRARIFRRLRER